MHPRYKTLIIDDEKLARLRLRKLLEPHTEWVEVIGEAENGRIGAEMVASLQPDLLFLDIQMPVCSGFEMLQQLPVSPRVVFVTAYEQYALQAFEQNSIDYLLKPIEASRLALTMEKLRRQTYGQWSSEMLQRLVADSQPPAKLKSLAVSVGDRLVILRLEELVYFQAEDKYVSVFLANGKKYLLTKSLTQLENELPDQFLRIHRTYLINRDFVLEMQRGFNYKWSVVMNDNERTALPCGASYTTTVKEKLGLS